VLAFCDESKMMGRVRTNNCDVARVLRHTLRTILRAGIDFLSFRRPWEIIIAYLVAVLGFACIFTFVLARDFYHPYVKFEPIVRAEKARFERSLDVAIAAELERNPDLGAGVKFERTEGSVVIQGAQEIRSRLSLTATYSFAMSLSRGDEQGRLFFVSIPILVSPFGLRAYFKDPGSRPPISNEGAAQGPPIGELGTVYIARDPQRPIEYEVNLTRRSQDQAAVSNAIAEAMERVVLTPEQRDRAAEILDADQGFPSGLHGSFSRMLYFSAVTITTVGYGDVVPLTGAARFFAALEATLGIILLGLFISSLAARAAARRDRTESW
jgi:Ion channel